MIKSAQEQVKKKKKKHWFKKRYGLVLLIIFFVIYFFKISNNYPWKEDLKYKPGYFGVTFSTKFCSELGLDWKETYLAIIDDLKVKQIRLPIYWDQIEKTDGVYDYKDYDYMIQEGSKRNVKFIANIGWRLPRWPECHAPEWAVKKSLPTTQAKALKMLENVVDHYKGDPSITAWQLENEPFFDAFGICPKSDESFFARELEVIKTRDSRPVIVSGTGELSQWKKEAKYGDIFGSTLYRVVWGQYTGYFRYPIPSWFYRFKAYLAGIKPQNRYIIELQAEPWVPSGNMIYLSPEEANKSFNLKQFRANLQYAINVNFEKTYIWGVEWWYYQYKNGDKSYWELARTLFN